MTLATAHGPTGADFQQWVIDLLGTEILRQADTNYGIYSSSGSDAAWARQLGCPSVG